MKIISEQSLGQFDAWSGAISTKECIIDKDKAEEFESYIEECYPNGLTDTELNDILWFEDEEIFSILGISEEDEEDEEE